MYTFLLAYKKLNMYFYQSILTQVSAATKIPPTILYWKTMIHKILKSTRNRFIYTQKIPPCHKVLKEWLQKNATSVPVAEVGNLHDKKNTTQRINSKFFSPLIRSQHQASSTNTCWKFFGYRSGAHHQVHWVQRQLPLLSFNKKKSYC